MGEDLNWTWDSSELLNSPIIIKKYDMHRKFFFEQTKNEVKSNWWRFKAERWENWSLKKGKSNDLIEIYH